MTFAPTESGQAVVREEQEQKTETESRSARPVRRVRREAAEKRKAKSAAMATAGKKGRKRARFEDYCEHSPDPIAVDTAHDDDDDDDDDGGGRRLSAWIKAPAGGRRDSMSSVPESEVDELVPPPVVVLPSLPPPPPPSAVASEAVTAALHAQSPKPLRPRVESGSGRQSMSMVVDADSNQHPIMSLDERPQKRRRTESPAQENVAVEQEREEEEHEKEEHERVVSEELSDSEPDEPDINRNLAVTIERDARNVFDTPTGPRTMKKFLVGNVGPVVAASDEDNDDDNEGHDVDMVDSPSRKTPLVQSTHTTSNGMSARKQLFVSSKLDVSRRASPSPAKPSGPAPNASPVKSSTSNLKRNAVIPVMDVSRGHVDLLKFNVLTKLTGKRKIPLRHREAQIIDVHTLLRETILRAESNSALLIGPKSTGKSLLVDTALQNFKDEGHEFLVVRLSGATQTDDRMALRAIARQLQPDHEEIANVDIMTALLAILAHPRDFGETEDPLSTVIVLDQFEQFTDQPRQTLLYNLFDIAQSRKAPICVLGLTNRVNAYDALEKRVKSRFSHRVIQFPHLPREQFATLARDFVLCDRDSEDAAFRRYREAWNAYVTGSAELQTFIHFTHLTTTNLLDFRAALVPMMATLGTSTLYFAFPPLATLWPSGQGSAAAGGSTHGGTVRQDLRVDGGKLSLLEGLSVLELALLISAARLEILSSGGTGSGGSRINLRTVVDVYTSLSHRATVSQRSTTGVTTGRTASLALCAIAWQRLLSLRLVLPQGGGAGGAGRSRLGVAATAAGPKHSEFGVVGVDVRLEEVAGMVRAGRVRIAHWMHAWLTV